MNLSKSARTGYLRKVHEMVAVVVNHKSFRASRLGLQKTRSPLVGSHELGNATSLSLSAVPSDHLHYYICLLSSFRGIVILLTFII